MGLKSIFTGWYKAFTNKHNGLSDERLKICGKCDKAKSRKILKILNGDERWENSLQCTICGCPCLEKSLVKNEQCPLNKW